MEQLEPRMMFMGDSPEKIARAARHYAYIGDPAETYARINVIRNQMGLTPGRMVSPDELLNLPLTSSAGRDLQDLYGTGRLAKLLNTLPVAGAAAGAGAYYSQGAK